jgi:hypothetical protein
MKLTFDYTLLKLDAGEYKRTLHTYLLDKLQEGGKLWLGACLAVIPVWSGASHGTFLKLANKIGMLVSISAMASIPGMLGPAVGSQKSTASIKSSNDQYILEYGTSLWHLIYNEYNNANLNPTAGRLFARLRTPGPYNFQKIGAEAFSAFATTVSLPSPWKLLKQTKHRV